MGIDSLLTSSNGATYADLDNDGDLDIVVNNMDDFAHIYENNSEKIEKQNFLKISFKGPNGNTLGIGTKVKVVCQGKEQVRELYLSRGFQSSVGTILNFGLGANALADQIKILWPDGASQLLTNVEANQTLVVDYVNVVLKKDQDSIQEPMFVDITEQSLIYSHMENEFNDFERESLLPHKMSEQGPALAVGDINRDGLDDFFIGGAFGFEASLYFQTKEGSFVASNQKVFTEEKNYEDVGAEFFDADNDGDLDLYVVSGGNESEEGSENYQDRLYENLNGTFVRSTTALPNFRESGSCVKPFDFDMDGDIDLFVGGRQIPGKYPYPASSQIFENKSTKGKIAFVDVTSKIAPSLQKIGMVTAAIWADVDQDTLTDLVIVGEWMPITVLKNQGGHFENLSTQFGLTNEIGWWNSISASDFDNDGDIDLVAGNLGLNYKYKASFEEPFEIYADDFDSSGSLDIVLGYYNGGILYPLRGRQCTSDQMPFVKKKFGNYDSFGKATLTEVYGSQNLDRAVHYAAKTFGSSYFENQVGKFNIYQLPTMAQLSSINSILTDDFDKDGHLDVLLAGNLYGSEVETPRNDASYGVYLRGGQLGEFEAVLPVISGIMIEGEVKHLRQLMSVNGAKIIIVAKNNGKLQFYRTNLK